MRRRNHNTAKRSFPAQEVSKLASKGALLHRVDHVTVSRFFLACAVTYPLFHHFCSPKYRKPRMGPHDLCAWSFEDGCLCSILHGLLQLQIWTAFLLPARLFPTVARQSATQLSHTTFSQLSEPTQGSSFTCTLLFPFPARFSALHCRSPSLAFILISTSGLSSL